MTTGDSQRAIAGQLAYRCRRAAPAIEIELIADHQVIEINHQQRIFLFRLAHALKYILRAQAAFFLAAGGDKANAVTGGDVL